MAYNVGTTTKVNTVAKVRSNIITTAMLAKNISNNNGIMPNTVVTAAKTTGRIRPTDESNIAFHGCLPSLISKSMVELRKTLWPTSNQ